MLNLHPNILYPDIPMHYDFNSIIEFEREMKYLTDQQLQDFIDEYGKKDAPMGGKYIELAYHNITERHKKSFH